jgi:predicted CopG family antitoxin
MAMGRPLLFDTPEKLLDKFYKYVDKCETTSIILPNGNITTKPITVTGFCKYAKVYRELLNEYKKKDNFSDTIKEIYNVIENDVEDGILTGKYNAVAGIFNLKNNHNWKDKHETELTGKDGSPLSITLDKKQSDV